MQQRLREDVQLTVVYDNVALNSIFKADWGFSCVVHVDDAVVLFDTGADGSILLHNMRALSLSPKNVDVVVLSHEHGDHTGGLKSVLRINPNAEVYRPEEVLGSKMVLPHCMLTKTMRGGGTAEQSLIIFTKRGLVVLTGCSHPGLENILRYAEEYGKVYGVVGGFHGFERFDVLWKVGLISPCHCTQHKEIIRELYPNVCVSCGVGRSIVI